MYLENKRGESTMEITVRYFNKLRADAIELAALKEKLAGKPGVMVTHEILDELQEAHGFLNCLCANGVDNWVWFDDAIEQWESYKEKMEAATL